MGERRSKIEECAKTGHLLLPGTGFCRCTHVMYDDGEPAAPAVPEQPFVDRSTSTRRDKPIGVPDWEPAPPAPAATELLQLREKFHREHYLNEAETQLMDTLIVELARDAVPFKELAEEYYKSGLRDAQTKLARAEQELKTLREALDKCSHAHHHGLVICNCDGCVNGRTVLGEKGSE